MGVGMSRREVTCFTCDVCGKDFEVRQEDADLCRYTVPVTFARDGFGLPYTHVRQETIDLCNDCAGRLAVLRATPSTEMRYDPESFEVRPFPTGQYTFKFGGDEE